MGLLHSRQQNASPETVSYHRHGACATGSDHHNGSVTVVDTSSRDSAPVNDVINAVAPSQVS